MNLNKKISIVISCHYTFKYFERCLESVINQTYKNLEIIIVNECLESDKNFNFEKYKKKDDRIKIINHQEKIGLFQSRVSGAKVATGDYIFFLNSDDYIDIDFCREMLFSAENEKSDIIVCDTVIEESKRRYLYNLLAMDKTIFEGEEIFQAYFKQQGYNFRWFTVCNKIYKASLWKEAEKHFSELNDNITQAEDFVLSTVLLYYAKKMGFNNRANYFKCSSYKMCTFDSKLTKNNCQAIIMDISQSFLFVEKFLKQKSIYHKYSKQFLLWRAFLLKKWYDVIQNSSLDRNNKEILANVILQIDEKILEYDYQDSDIFYSVTTEFNDRLMALKNKILENKIISFDIFDTLLVRPFYEPKDLFFLMNTYFNKLFNSNGLLEFSEMRIEAEKNVRDKMLKEKGYEDISLNEIYDSLAKLYHLSIEKLEKIKEREIELEIYFCKKRETIYSLYSMCNYLKKSIYFTTDMYLPRDVIEKILLKNGYQYFDGLYISGEVKLAKYTGNLFKYIIKEHNINPKEMMHIGDNIESDVKIPCTLNINTFFFPKTTDLFNNYCRIENNVNYCGKLYENFQLLNIDHSNVTDYMGNRISLAMVANRFFDNPFISFNDNSDFNCNPYLIGYYTLGMHMLSLVNWLLTNAKEKKYDSFCFQARDGYLPYLVALKLKDNYDLKDLKIKYIYCSRNALMPLILNDYKNFYKISDYLNLNTITIADLLDNLKDVITLDNNYEQILNDNGLFLSDFLIDKEKFYKLIDIIYNKFYNHEKYDKYFETAKQYFSECFNGNSATFDIGYSAKPELFISNIINKKIDTYFIHCNNHTGYKNAKYGQFNLYTFYDFKPTFTGTLREYLISSNSPSCAGYSKVDNNIKIEFTKGDDYSYFDRYILNQLQNACIDFVNDYIIMFKDYKDIIELNRYYMSLPLEYYLHYSKPVDRKIFLNLHFESNLSEKINILNLWDESINNYLKNNSKYNTDNGNNEIFTYNDFLREKVGRCNKVTKFFFYLKFDRSLLRHKVKAKLKKIYKKIKK